MRLATKRRLSSLIPAILIALLMGGSLLSFQGCSSVSAARKEAKMLYDGAPSAIGTYQRTMVALPFENDVQWIPSDFSTTFTSLLKSAIETEGSKIRVLFPNDADFPAGFNQPQRLASGDPDGYRLAAAGRDVGANMILFVKLAAIRHETEDRGMFWFAKVVDVARIQMQITIFHTGTGARLLDRSIFYGIDISGETGRQIDAGELPADLQFDEALADISETLGKFSRDILKHIPWEGYVSQVSGDQVTLSAGEASGLKKGKHLAVYSATEVTGDEGLQQFSAPGTQIGTITITAVYPDHCDAVVSEGGPLQPGNVVKNR
jgi:hypothetical protein